MMNPRDAVQFLKTRTGVFLVFLILCLIGYFIVRGFQPPGFGTRSQRKADDGRPATPQVVQSVTKDMTPFRPPQEQEPKPPSTAKQAPPPPKPLPPLSLFAQAPVPPTVHDELGDNFAPYGRLISCQLIITVDSSALDTPIIGLVTEDVWHNGRLIVPVGTEVHGTARVDRMRERIASQGNWTLVWQGGKEMRLSGLALDREKEATGEGWAITDGSAGLRGLLLKSDEYAEIKLFAASFLSGAAGAFTERETTLLGSQATASVGNAALGGTQQVLNTYAKQIMDTIQREGFYVRVPAGKQFYLYVTETMNAARASVGGSRKPAPPAKP
jgi:hypothetical protein